MAGEEERGTAPTRRLGRETEGGGREGATAAGEGG